MFVRKLADQPTETPFLRDEVSARQVPQTPLSSRITAPNIPSYALPTTTESQPAEGVVIIGKGTHVSGDITHCLKVDIQGSVEGRISAQSLVIRDGGSMKGEIHANNAEINGSLEGQVDVTGLLDVRSTGRVEGDLAYGKLSVAMGGHITGQIKNAEAHSDAPGHDAVSSLPENVSFLNPQSDHP